MTRLGRLASIALALLTILPAAAPLVGAAVAPAVSITSKGGNEWWVEAIVSGADAKLVSKVESRDSFGAWVGLSYKSWGAWGASYHIEPGNLVVFKATLSDGRVVTSCAFTHPKPVAQCGVTVPPAPGEVLPPPTKVEFTPRGGNEWWVQVAVTGQLTKVEAKDTNGSWVNLVLRSWGDWAASFRVEPGHLVTYRATQADGTQTTSCDYAHPLGGCVTAPAPAPAPVPAPAPAPAPAPTKLAHTNIVATTFWVGEIFDPTLPDGSQVCSTYDALWAYHWSGVNNGRVPDTAGGCQGAIVGGCDGVPSAGKCSTEKRTAANNYFPTSPDVKPRENPFYLDLPFDDLNDPIGFKTRCQVIPWANQPAFAGRCTDKSFSYMKNHWVQILGPNGKTCYGQIQDAGPSHGDLYHDAAYVFGTNDARPTQTKFNNAGMDVSPALNGCLGFQSLDGQSDRVSWQFVDEKDVPDGPWKIIVTTSQVTN